MSRNSLKYDVRTPIILAILSLVSYFLLDEDVFKWPSDGQGEIIKLVPDGLKKIVKILSLIVTIIGICWAFFIREKNILRSINRKNHKILIEIEENLQFLRDNNIITNNVFHNSLTDKYIIWIASRFNKALKDIRMNKLPVLESGHYYFANMIYKQAKRKIICTCMVDPEWYNKTNTLSYINDQKEMIAKSKSKLEFTRIFFYKDTDIDTRKEKLKKLILDQLQKGFHVILSKTPDGETEKDVQRIDTKYILKAELIDDQSEYKSGDCYMDINDEHHLNVYLNGVINRDKNEKFAPTEDEQIIKKYEQKLKEILKLS